MAEWEDARGSIAARDFARATEILERVSEAVLDSCKVERIGPSAATGSEPVASIVILSVRDSDLVSRALDRIRAPILIAHGAHDSTARPADAYEIVTSLTPDVAAGAGDVTPDVTDDAGGADPTEPTPTLPDESPDVEVADDDRLGRAHGGAGRLHLVLDPRL